MRGAYKVRRTAHYTYSNMNVKKGIYVSLASSAIVGSLLIGSIAFADTTTPQGPGGWGGRGHAGVRAPGVIGTVASISGSTITVTAKAGPNGTPAAATYTVDASNATVTKAGASSSVANITAGDTVFVQGTVNGTSVTATAIRDGIGFGAGQRSQKPGVFGTVASISGTTLAVTSKGFGPNAAAATYTVDASSATVTKDGAASSVAAIAVGDTVGVQGTVSGTSVAATAIRDGVEGPGSRTPVITGNGEPVVGGAVTAVSGTTLTITNKSNVTYTIDASSATVQKGNATSSIAGVVIGDNVVVQGTVNGTAVTATSVIDQGSAASAGTSRGDTNGPVGGFLGAIGGIFHRLFGFF